MTTATAAPRRSRRLLAPLATLVAATGIALASGASFSTSTASEGLVASGTLTQLNSSTVAFSKDNLKPGDVVTGTVTVTNTGTLDALYSITETESQNTFAPKSDVTLKLTEDGTTISNTTLGAFGTLDRPVAVPAGQSRTYVFTISFNADAANTQQGKAAKTTYTFNTVQTAGQTYEATNNSTSSTQITSPAPAPAP